MLRAAGGSMHDAGIDDGDLLLVDRSITPAHGHVVVAIVEQELVCRQFWRKGNDVRLQAASGDQPDILPREDMPLEVLKQMPT